MNRVALEILKTSGELRLSNIFGGISDSVPSVNAHQRRRELRKRRRCDALTREVQSVYFHALGYISRGYRDATGLF